MVDEQEIAARARHAVIKTEILTLAETVRMAEALPNRNAIRRACRGKYKAQGLIAALGIGFTPRGKLGQDHGRSKIIM